MHSGSCARAIQHSGAVLSLCLLVSGCSMLGSKIHSTAKGSVYLEEVADWSYSANHPAVVDQDTLLKAIKGVVANDVVRGASKMPASGSTPMRVFSDEDAEFLAPLLAQGLSQAKPEQIVGFKVSPSAGSGSEPTAGTLYVLQGSLYLTVTPSANRKVSGFIPSTAARIEKAPSYAAEWAPGAKSLIIDYQTLAAGAKPTADSLHAAAPVAKPVNREDPAPTVQSPAASAPAAGGSEASQLSSDELLSKKLDELRDVREANKRKDTEIAVLKREVEWMKQELRERTAEVNAIKATKASGRSMPKNKPAEVTPSR